MPIYAYRCEACGFAKDVLQKMSDPMLTDCPECKQAAFKKQVTAAGFQLKGSGWYVTDFREGNKPAVTSTEPKTGAETKVGDKAEVKVDAKTDAKADSNSGSKTESGGKSSEATSPAPASTPAPSTPASSSSTAA